jgi:hypothetical protein
MYPLRFINTAILSSDEQSLLAGLLVSCLFGLYYRKLQRQIDREDLLDGFLN